MQILHKSDRSTVQLLHKMPDGSSHIDWMIAPEDDDDMGELMTFRLQSRLDKVQKGQRILAERISNHRRLYLDYQGPISDNRGVVSRVAEGVITSEKRDESSWRLEISWETDSNNVIHQKLHMREIQTQQEGTVMEALCETLEIVYK